MLRLFDWIARLFGYRAVFVCGTCEFRGSKMEYLLHECEGGNESQ